MVMYGGLHADDGRRKKDDSAEAASPHLLSLMADRAWCTSPCRCSTFLL